MSLDAFEAGNQKNTYKVYSYFSKEMVGIHEGIFETTSWQDDKNGFEKWVAQLSSVEFSVHSSEVEVLSADAAIFYGIYSITSVDHP